MMKQIGKRIGTANSLVKNWKRIIISLYVLLILFFIFKGVPVLAGWGPGPNNINYSVRTTVNVTNAYPEILNISCNNSASVTLTAGSTHTVTCLVQMRDYNGGNTILVTNGTFYYYLNQSNNPDDNNTHYTNNSCLNISTSGYYTNWTCGFDLWYYALNGTWVANVTTADNFGASTSSTGNGTIGSLLALNVTSLIDYGNLQVTQTSNSIQANVTNFGNVPLNVTVYGFGGNDSVLGAGLAMICDQRNLTLPNERYDLNSATVYDSMTPLTGSPATISGLKISKQSQPNVYVVNSTYWRLHVNLSTNPFGICNGTVVFAAISP